MQTSPRVIARQLSERTLQHASSLKSVRRNSKPEDGPTSPRIIPRQRSEKTLQYATNLISVRSSTQQGQEEDRRKNSEKDHAAASAAAMHVSTPNKQPSVFRLKSASQGLSALQKSSIDPIKGPMLSSDADIRCAAKVSVGQQLTVWTGERDGSLRIRDAKTQDMLSKISQDERVEDYVWSILQDGDNVWVGTSAGRMRVYCAANQQLRVERIRHAGGIYALARLGNFVYSASNDFTILEWNRVACDTTNRILAEHTNQVRCLCACAGYLVSGSDDHSINVWDVSSTAIRSTSFRRHSSVLAMTSVPSNRSVQDRGLLWVGDGSGDLAIYDLAESKCVSTLQEHRGPVCNLLFQHTLVFSASVDKTIKTWDPALRSCLQTIEAHQAYISALVPVATYSQAQFWSFGGDQRVHCWSAELGQLDADRSERLPQDYHYQERRLAQIESQCEAAKLAEESARKDVQRLSEILEAERENRRQMDQRQQDEIARLTADLFARDEKLAHVINELDECALAREELTKTERELRSRLEGNAAESDKLITELASVREELSIKNNELQTLHEQHESANKRLYCSGQEKVQLQETLEKAKSAAASESRRCNALQEQLTEQESLKTSRLAFVTEVWALHKHVADAKTANKCRTRAAPIGQRAPPADRTCTASGHPETSAHGITDRAYEKSTMIIKKFLTDDEKLHLGIPLAQFEGGHDTSPPLDWSCISDETSGSSPRETATPQQDTRYPDLLTGGTSVQRGRPLLAQAPKVGSPMTQKKFRSIRSN